jgi:hypothetical protein
MKKIFAFLFFLNITCYSIKAQSNMLLFGPTLHYNIGGGLNNLVFGLELSYWRENTALQIISPALGFDIGLEFEKSKTRIYTELQYGLLFGLSGGYVCQFGDHYECSGYQCSAWGAYYGGIELRYRKLNNIDYFAPGGILKFPFIDNVKDINMPGDIYF